MKILTRALSAAAILLLVGTAGAQEAQKPFEEQIDVSAVLIDTIVADRTGHQILGLTKDDFVVKENGVEQKIDSVDYYTNLRMLDAREESAPFQVQRVNEGRNFVFFFDKPEDPQVLWDRMMNARQAVKKFIDGEMVAGDRVAIVGHDQRLKVYSDFTSDKAKLKKALDQVTTFGPGLTKAGAESPSILKNLEANIVNSESGTLYRALDVLGDALRPVRGRKNLILFSPGVLGLDESVSGDIAVSRSKDFEPMIESLNAANVSVYPVQIQREYVSTPYVHQRLEEIAAATSGQYYRMNVGFSRALDRIENENNGYYLITYQSRHRKGERGFQKVEVSVKNPEFRVTSRAGYMYGE